MSHFLMDQVGPVFNAVQDVDFGPTTLKAVRYSIADYKKMLRLSVVEPPFFPVEYAFAVIIGASTFPETSTPGNATLFAVANNSFAQTIPSPPDITYSRNSFVDLTLSSPTSPDADWTTGHVWLPFQISFPGVSATVPGTDIQSDYLGIDYAVPVGVGIAGTVSYSLGDGTTRAYFAPDASGNRLVTTALTVNNF